MPAHILRADAGALPLPDGCVDLIVTSPPYWALRSYTDGGAHYAGQIGAEPTPAAYIDALIECTREWMRVLKPGGSIWVNLGDKYNGSGGTSGHTGANGEGQRAPRRANKAMAITPVKSLMMLPERYRIAAVDQLGLIARAVVIWSKPNGLPESVTDRVRRSHEDWVHLVKQPRYFSAVDAIREPQDPANARPNKANRAGIEAEVHRFGATSGMRNGDTRQNPLGKLPGSVWEIATQPLKVPADLGVDHFAAFPMEWPRRIIAGWSPSGICAVCGEGRRPLLDRTPMLVRPSARRLAAQAGGGAQRTATGRTMIIPPTAVIVGSQCACPDDSAPTRPAVVLDPFGGTGTTALVADALGRRGVSVDMSADYCRLAAWRTTDPGQRAAALEVEKPATQMKGQGDLFSLLEGDS